MSLGARLHSAARESAREAHCLACERRPDEVRTQPSLHEASEVFSVRCHGATARMVLTDNEVMAGQLKPFIARLRGLFAEHAHPDVKELLRYNREGWTP